MSAGKCKRGPENPLGATSSSSSSDDDSPRRDVATTSTKASTSSSTQVQLPTHRRVGAQQQQHLEVRQPCSLSPAPAAAAHSSGLPATLPIGSLTEQLDTEVVDYDAASSPSGSSTLSGGSVYVRQPGFTEHAHTHRVLHSARRPRTKKKKNSVVRGAGVSFEGPTDEDGEEVMVTSIPSSTTSLLVGAATVAGGNGVEGLYAQQQQGGLTNRQPTVRHSVVARAKTHRDPVPMRMRALPQSMWQEPNVPHNVSPATVYPVLPPLVTREGDDITSLRPVTPPEDRDELDPRASNDKSTATKTTGADLRRHQQLQYTQQLGRHQQLQPGERVISVANPELLMQLFDVLHKEPSTKTGRSYGSHAKKVSSKKVIIAPHYKTTLFTGHDPHMVDNIAESLFPQLSLERGGGGGGGSTARSSGAYGSGTMMVHLQPLPVGDKTIMLPSLSVDQNYPQMLSELVANI